MDRHGLIDPELRNLVHALRQVRLFLGDHGDGHLCARLEAIEARLGDGERGAVATALSEATGGMGSLRDRTISAANGDSVSPEREQEANDRLAALVDDVERRAREAAAALGLKLSR